MSAAEVDFLRKKEASKKRGGHQWDRPTSSWAQSLRIR